MNFKIVFAIFGAFAVAQASAKFVKVTDDDSELLKTISGVLLELNKAIASLLTEVSDAVKKAESETGDITKGISKIATGLGDTIVSFILKELDGITDKADDDGKKFIQCINKDSDTFKALLQTTLDEIVICSADQLGELLVDVKVLVDDVSTSHDKLNALETNLAACTDGITVCGKDFLDNAATIASDLVATLKTDYKAAKDLIDQLEDKILGCADKSLATMEPKNSDIFNEILTCIES